MQRFKQRLYKKGLGHLSIPCCGAIWWKYQETLWQNEDGEHFYLFFSRQYITE